MPKQIDRKNAKKNEIIRLQQLRKYDIIKECGEEKFKQIVKLAARIFNTDYAGIHFLDEETQSCKVTHGFDLENMQREESVCQHTIQSSDPLIVNDLRKDERFRTKSYVTGTPHFASYAGVPLETGEQQRIGTLCVMDTESREFSDEQIEALQLLAKDVMAHLELFLRNRQLDEVNRKMEEQSGKQEAMIKEIHHRLKNNLSYIIGILDLELMNNDNPEIQHIVKKVQNRIMSVATIHQRLYESSSLEHLDLKSYLEELAEDIKNSFSEESQNIKCRVTGDTMSLSNEYMTPFGLLVSELLINAFKHAFKGLDEGLITIHLEQQDNLYRIEIQDNGIGLPDDFNLDNPESMGSQLIVSFLEQLEADIDWNSDNGTRFVILFAPH